MISDRENREKEKQKREYVAEFQWKKKNKKKGGEGVCETVENKEKAKAYKRPKENRQKHSQMLSIRHRELDNSAVGSGCGR